MREHFDIQIRRTRWQTDRTSLSLVRRRVFIDEQGVDEADEWDDQDASADHWVALHHSDGPIATARLTVEGQLGRMAVLPGYRSRGIASKLLQDIIAFAAETGFVQLRLNAQLAAIPLYQRHGFEVNGPEFLDAGMPHRPMQLNLDEDRR